MHYYAIAERGREGWFLTFPGAAGYTFARSAFEVPDQARDWFESAAMHGGALPRSIEDGAQPPADVELADYDKPLVVVVQFDPAAAKRRVPA